jgi:hypothetical protein
MSTISHDPSEAAERKRRWSVDDLRVREMWASLAIAAMWLAVSITAIWGPDARFSSSDGSGSTIPTAVFVTFFAFLGTWIVARHGFRRDQKD